jgi:SAM-dependent methyltransferase
VIPHCPTDLQKIYQARFAGQTEYRQKVWQVLCSFFSKWIRADGETLDLGCGHCEFINNIECRRKYAMDLNPDAGELAARGIGVLLQDCSEPWPIAPDSLDTIFSSNFFEHLPTKSALEITLRHAYRALRQGGKLILMGPNIKYVPGAYWDFFDHYIALTELSVAEVLTKCGFQIDVCIDRFLPYSMSQRRAYPIWALKIYLAMPWVWPFFGKQFLVVARK